MHHGEGKILIEEVAEETAHAQVGPAAVDQQETLEEAELGEGVVAGQHGLDPLLTWDTNSNMSAWRNGEERCTEKEREIKPNEAVRNRFLFLALFTLCLIWNYLHTVRLQ